MTKKELQCLSCKKNQTNSIGSAVFPCPECREFEIVRCKQCRKIATAYTCPQCGFTGPA